MVTNKTITKKKDDLILTESMTIEEIRQKLKEPNNETDGETCQQLWITSMRTGKHK
jgi:hypothetical protein